MNFYKRLPPIFLLSLLIAAAPAVAQITSFKFETQYNPSKLQENIIADIYGDTLIVGIIPHQQAEFNLVATFTTAIGTSVKVNGVDQQSTITINDFSTPVTYVEESHTYTVKLVYTGLPVVYVYTQNAAPILNRDDYVAGTVRIYPSDQTAVFNGAMGIRGRGNTTWTLDKKPYRIKLGTAASILGMPSDKDWVLLANHADKTLMRNTLAYHLGAQMNFAYTQRSQHVDLVLNGMYQGTYVLGEHIKVDKDRVNIKELGEDDTDAEVITGGYFLELDDYRDGLFFELNSGLPFVIKDPEDLPQVQLDYIKNYMQQTEDVINSETFSDPVNGYAKYIDIETFIEWYWVMEVLKNIDAQDVSSIFYYKDRGEKLKMGPLWDLDVSAGNASVNTGDDPTEFYVRESKWFKRLFEDPAFKTAADARWFTFKEELLSKLPGEIDSLAAKLNLSQQENFHKWDVLDQTIWPSPNALGSYQNEVDYLKNWLSTRIAWIDARIPKPELKSFALRAPVNNTRIFVSPDDASSVKFSWTGSTAGSTYNIYIETVAYSASQDTTLNITATDLYKQLVGDSITLRWTVQASRDERTMLARDTFLVKLINGVVGIPRLHLPTANDTIESITPNIIWSKAYLATGYNVQVSWRENFETVDVNATVSDTSYLVKEQLAKGTKYYWRVRAVNSNSWSAARAFRTPEPQPAPAPQPEPEPEPVIVGVEDVNYVVSISPNPASGDLFIDVPKVTTIERAEVVDALGRIALNSQIVPGITNRIDVGGLQRGMYVVILRGGVEKPLARRILLR